MLPGSHAARCRLVTIFAFSVLLSFGLPPCQLRASQLDSAREVAAALIETLHSTASRTATAPQEAPSWVEAQPGEPLEVWGDGADTPSYAVVPVVSPADEIVGSIGVGLSDGHWLWYSELDVAQPLVSADQALRALWRRVPKASLAAEPRLVSMPDRHLYWHLSWRDSSAHGRDTLVDLGDSSRVLSKTDFDVGGPESLLSPPRALPLPRSVESQGEPTPLLRPPEFELSVPYHSQMTSYHCGPASLQMVFDFWGENIGQMEIGQAAATSGEGTDHSDLRRAAHFSQISSAFLPPPLQGYTGRELGYAALENEWSSADPGFETRYEDLKRLLTDGYPILILTYYDLTYSAGHYRVLKGFSDPLDSFTVHDPWYTPPFMGSNVHFNQSVLVDQLWTYWSVERWALLACPWQVELSAPDSVESGEEFTVTARITYPAPLRFEGQDQVAEATAAITQDAGLVLASGEVASRPLAAIGVSGTSQEVSWRLLAPPDGEAGTLAVSVAASGMVSDISPASSREEYVDEIGGHGSCSIVVRRNSEVPVLLTSFHAQYASETVVVRWQTSEAVDPRSFRLEARRAHRQRQLDCAEVGSREYVAYDDVDWVDLSPGAPGEEATYTLYLMSNAGWHLLDSMTIESSGNPLRTRLLRVQPNPCNPHATISFSNARAQEANLAVYDLAGRRVALLASGLQGAGKRTVRWRGLDARGREVPSGVYLVRLTTRYGIDSRKLILLR